MSPGHLSLPVHAIHAMSQGHTSTFKFCFKLPVCQGAWFEFDNILMSPTSISLSSCYACRIPGTCRYPFILFQNSPFVKAQGFRLIMFSCPWDIYQSLFMLCTPCPRDIEVPLLSVSKLPVCQGAGIAIDNIFMSPGHLSVPIHAIHAMSQGHTGTFTFCIETHRLSRRMDWDW